MGKNYVLILVILLGVLGSYGVWTYRFGEAYEHGFNEGYVDGNLTGVFEGYEVGIEEGYTSGYQSEYNTVIEIGKFEGNQSGYADGYDNGLEVGYKTGFDEGNLTGCVLGYAKGIETGSEGYDIRDPTYGEALEFINSDNTDFLFETSENSTYMLLGYIRKNAFERGYRLLWVSVDVVGLDGSIYFTAFNTTDRGLVVFSYRHDIFLDLKLWEPCYDLEVWVEPSFDDRVTKIEYVP